MNDYNDSLDDIYEDTSGAIYRLECLSHNGDIDHVYVYPGQCIGSIEKACWRSSFHVKTIDLVEQRRHERILNERRIPRR